ncbi:MAG: glycine betaine ABC transporter substrate-binding protein, partial [Bacteroidales bacterium]
DPKAVYGDEEQIYAYARNGFSQEHAEVSKLIAQMHFDGATLAGLLAKLQEADDYQQEIEKWIADNQSLVNSWKKQAFPLD